MLNTGGVRFHVDEDDQSVAIELGALNNEQKQAPAAAAVAAKTQFSSSAWSKVDKSDVGKAASAIPYWLSWPMFGYPFVANEVSSRFAAIMASAIGLIGIIFRHEHWMWFIIAALFADFALRFTFGTRASVIGALAEGFAAPFPKKLVPGAPQQFSLLVGAIFSGVSALVFFLRDSNQGIAGACIIAVYMGIATLEWTSGLSLGSIFFDIFVKLGYISKEYETKFNAIIDETYRTYESEAVTEPQAETVVLVHSGQVSVPVSYKASTEATKRGDRSFVKNMSITAFSLTSSIAGLAALWKYTSEATDVFTHDPVVFHILAIAAGSLFFVLFVLYLLKAIWYPTKVLREWNHPVKRYAFSHLTISGLLFTYLAAGSEDGFAEVLYWISAPAHLFYSIVIFSSWLKQSINSESLNPAWLSAPVGNLLAALVISKLKERYLEAGWLWFGIGVFLWVVLFTTSLLRVATGSLLLDSVRPYVMQFVAAPALVTSAYLALTGGVWGPFARITFYITLVIFLALVWATATAFFGRSKFNGNWWVYGFPIDMVALVTTQYYVLHQTDLTEAMATIAIVLANAVNAIFLANTIASFLLKEDFVAEFKFTPLSINGLFHSAIKQALNKSNKLASQLTDSNKEVADQARAAFIASWNALDVVLQEHARQEDTVLFKYMNKFFPGITSGFDAEHAAHEEKLAHVRGLVAAATADANVLPLLQQEFSSFADEMNKHMTAENNNLAFIPRKYFSVSLQQQIVKEQFNATESDRWAIILPFLMKNEFNHAKRVAALTTFAWAIPEYAQHIGRLVYEGVDDLLWNRLIVDVPSIIPRNVDGHIDGNVRYW